MNYNYWRWAYARYPLVRLHSTVQFKGSTRQGTEDTCLVEKIVIQELPGHGVTNIQRGLRTEI
jgi:hypothetical protein